MAMQPTRSKALVPILLALAGFGCGKEEGEPPSAAPSPPAATPGAPPAAEPPAEAPRAALPTPEPVAEAPAWRGELPRDFPADVPHYPGSKVVFAKGTEELGFAVQFDSQDAALDTIAKFYADGLAAAGWQTQPQQIPEGTLIVADKEDRRAHVLVRAGGQGSLVDIIVGPPE
jgi:hypothetical protein